MVKKVNGRHYYISIDNCKIHVEEAGEGKPLVLVHGLGGSLMWQRVVEPLSEHFRLFVLDLPGFGESESSNKTYSTKEHAELLVKILQHFTLENISLAGVSYGGQVAATFAAMYPERVEKLVLTCSTGLAPTPFIISNTVLRELFSFVVKVVILTNQALLCLMGRRSFYDVASRPEDLCRKFFEQLSKPGHQDAWLNCLYNVFTGGREFKQKLTEIQTPTLILWGENDVTVVPKHGREFQNLIPNSTLQLFSECAHSVPLEIPKELTGALRSFCMG
ncbi:MAG: alpha/beta hydrolase [Ignavibacteriae bacterium]|nr:alpha/beta hydrolase [Ignavibacteriota bacterium]